MAMDNQSCWSVRPFPLKECEWLTLNAVVVEYGVICMFQNGARGSPVVHMPENFLVNK